MVVERTSCVLVCVCGLPLGDISRAGKAGTGMYGQGVCASTVNTLVTA